MKEVQPRLSNLLADSLPAHSEALIKQRTGLFTAQMVLPVLFWPLSSQALSPVSGWTHLGDEEASLGD